jgi:hypothetical protein
MQAQGRQRAELAALDDVQRDVLAKLVAVDEGVAVVAPPIDVGVLASGAEAVGAQPLLAVWLGHNIEVEVVEIEPGHQILLKSSFIAS